MPLHLDSLTNDPQNREYLAHILGPVFTDTFEAFPVKDKKLFYGRSKMIDVLTGKMIGKFCFTIWENTKKQRNEILDLDITLDNPDMVALHFLERLDRSDPVTEYYDVETAEGEQHLEIETANRYAINKDIADTVQDVFISIFPFKVNMFDDMKGFNEFMGFSKPIKVGPIDFHVGGLSETFIAPGNMIMKDGEDGEAFVVGTVESCRDVKVNMGKTNLSFVLAQVKTALGAVPVAMSRDVFQIEGIRPGKILAMLGFVKADLAKPEMFFH